MLPKRGCPATLVRALMPTWMPQLPAKAISSSVVAMPPSLMSWPARMRPSASSAWVVLKAARSCPVETSGDSSPICNTRGTAGRDTKY